MSGSNYLLVASDARLASTVHAAVFQGMDEAPTLHAYSDVRAHLGPETTQVLLLVSATPNDASQALRLVQEIVLRGWPVTVVSLEANEDGIYDDLEKLDPYVANRLHWPEQKAALIHFLRGLKPPSIPQVGRESESIPATIHRRLATMTPSLTHLADRMALAATHDVTVLITGETGTGKTYLARLLHECSPRRQHRFLAVPCGALSANLIESEFFGHSRGAFTGADRAKVGKFAAAGQGTILLDEIDALGLEQQANLLRVIETGEYEPVGSNETLHCPARIMVASNWNLEEAVQHGRFREDLYYRLNVMAFQLPPLRERPADVAPLVRGMAARFSQKFHKDLFEIHPDALAVLETFPWPGNIRQLENAIQQAVLVSSGAELRVEHLPQALQEHAGVRSTVAVPPRKDSLARSKETLERSVIQRALMTCGYSRARAALALGISRVTLYKKMKKYDLTAVPLSPNQLDQVSGLPAGS